MVELSAVVSDATRVVEKDGLTAAQSAARSAVHWVGWRGETMVVPWVVSMAENSVAHSAGCSVA